MKSLFTILLFSICLIAFGQKKDITASSNGITIADEIKLNQLGLDKKVELSKGESLQQKDWEEFLKQFQKQNVERQKYFHQRDSLHQIFLRYTVMPYINPDDSIAEFKQSQKEFSWKEFKPKKK